MSGGGRRRAGRRKRKSRGPAGSDPPPAGPGPGAGQHGDAAAERGAAAGEQGAAAIQGAATAEQGAAAGEPGATIEDVAAEAERRGVSRSQVRDERVRAELEPLAAGERPAVVTIGALIALAIALSILIAYAAGAKVDVEGSTLDERPNAFQVFPPAILFLIMAWGMWGARYWAVLGFQAIMAIIMIGAFLTLIAATTAFKAVSALLILAAAAALFWFTVKALARIQMPTPGGRDSR